MYGWGAGKGARQEGWGRRNLQGQNDSGTRRERREARQDAGGRALGPGASGPARGRPRVRAAPGREPEAPGRVGGAARPRSPPHHSPRPGAEGRREGAPAASSVRGGSTHLPAGRGGAAGVSSSAVARAQAPAPGAAAAAPDPSPPPRPPPLPALPPRRLSRRRLSRRRLSHRRLSGPLSRRYRRQSPSAGARTGARRRERARARPAGRRHPQPPPPAGGARAGWRRARARHRRGRGRPPEGVAPPTHAVAGQRAPRRQVASGLIQVRSPPPRLREPSSSDLARLSESEGLSEFLAVAPGPSPVNAYLQSKAFSPPRIQQGFGRCWQKGIYREENEKASHRREEGIWNTIYLTKT
ncbi:translation initiation factor IF-2 [Bubalus bubalis]|uniref:translation initiation factor IF-2 n=1 Tax=Bubalus bubalis TaxID=89462 RepID=UPI001E1B710D|nr:translation initiation factor IF-2 [Bubalus bubalis]